MASKLLVNELQAATGTDITITAGHSLVGAASVFKIAGGIAGQALITDGAGNISFGTVSSLPTQSGQAGKFLKTDGTDASWGTVATDPTMGGDLTGTASNAQIAAGAVDTAEIAADAVTSNEIAAGAVSGTEVAATFDISSKTVTLPAASVTAHVTQTDTTGIEDDIALLGFRVASNGSLAKYNLVDQTIDAFEDATGIDASGSTDEVRNASNYYSGINMGSYTINAFTSTGASTWTCPANTTEAEVLIGAGGGGGGNGYYAAGGGAGGVVHDTDYAVTAGVVYDITVGSGGAVNTSGSDSVWNVNAEGSGITMTAIGGGHGWTNGNVAENGGSGGGGKGSSSAGTSTQTSPTGATGYGNDGGPGNGDPGGGGGGSVAAGSAGVGNEGGAAGAGREFSNFDSYGTNSSNAKPTVDGSGSGKGYFGGGGGGGAWTGSSSVVGGAAGVGGGGKGGGYGSASGRGATAGLANTGGGGGGGGGDHGGGDISGKAGGSGIVLIRHRTEAYNDITLISNATTAEAVPTKGDLVMTYSNGVGTTSIGDGTNGDIRAFVSRDNGTNYTQVTLASQGSTGAHTILSAHDLDISGQPSGTAMRYKITTHNQSVTKETRIQAVSLGWS